MSLVGPASLSDMEERLGYEYSYPTGTPLFSTTTPTFQYVGSKEH